MCEYVNPLEHLMSRYLSNWSSCLPWQWRVWETSSNIHFTARSQKLSPKAGKSVEDVIEEEESNKSRFSIATGGTNFLSVSRTRVHSEKMYKSTEIVHGLFRVKSINFYYFLSHLQLTIIERQVFDFLGPLWLPILANFSHMILIIFGFFGAYQFRTKYLISVSVNWIRPGSTF